MEFRDRNLEDILIQKWSMFDRAGSAGPRFEAGAPRLEAGGPRRYGPAAEAETLEPER